MQYLHLAGLSFPSLRPGGAGESRFFLVPVLVVVWQRLENALSTYLSVSVSVNCAHKDQNEDLLPMRLQSR